MQLWTSVARGTRASPGMISCFLPDSPIARTPEPDRYSRFELASAAIRARRLLLQKLRSAEAIASSARIFRSMSGRALQNVPHGKALPAPFPRVRPSLNRGTWKIAVGHAGRRRRLPTVPRYSVRRRIPTVFWTTQSGNGWVTKSTRATPCVLHCWPKTIHPTASLASTASVPVLRSRVETSRRFMAGKIPIVRPYQTALTTAGCRLTVLA